jgi:hypothetical protein
MVFREVSVIEIREVLGSWLAGAGLRKQVVQLQGAQARAAGIGVLNVATENQTWRRRLPLPWG